MTPPVRWLPVVGFEGLYEVSDQGQVRSISRTKRNGRRLAGRILKSSPTGAGYPAVTLSRDGTPTTRRIHKLVMEAFVGPPPPGMEVRHGNGIHSDVRLSNLSYSTHPVNCLDRAGHGADFNAAKTHCRNGHGYTPANTYIDPQGGRECRICRAKSSRDFKQRKRQAKAGVAA